MERPSSGPRLRELHWLEPDTCRAVFEDDGELVETVFRISRDDGITVATDDASILGRIDGTAAQIRSVVAAVANFCTVAQGGSTE